MGNGNGNGFDANDGQEEVALETARASRTSLKVFLTIYSISVCSRWLRCRWEMERQTELEMELEIVVRGLPALQLS